MSHRTRHSFYRKLTSNCQCPGGDQWVIDEFTGYQTEAMRKRYRHLFAKDRRSAIESLTYALRPENPRDP